MSTKSCCYSYARFSTLDQQHGHSLERQLSKSRKFAEDNNLQLVDEMVDLGVSAFHGQHEDSALAKFKGMVAAGLVPVGSYFCFENLDRLSRMSPMLANQQLFDLLNAGIIIATLDDGQIYSLASVTANPMQLMIALISSITANQHSVKLSERLKAVNKSRREKANEIKIKGQHPNWLRLDNNVFIENEKLCNAIRKMFELSINGFGSYAITKFLNDNIEEYPVDDIKRNSTKWGQSYIVNILNSRKVFGEFQPREMKDGKQIAAGEPIKNYYPVVVSEEDFNISKLKSTQRTTGSAGPKGLKITNIFAKLLHCECGSSFILKDSQKYAKYLLCSNKNIKFDCKSNSWIYDDFERFIFNGLKELDINSIFSDSNVIYKSKLIQKSLDLLDLELNQKTLEYNNLIEKFALVPAAILDDLIKLSETTKNRIVEIESNIKNLNDELLLTKITSNNTNIQQQLKAYDELVLNKSDNEIKEIRQKIQQELYKLIDKIVLFNNNKFEINDDIRDISTALDLAVQKKKHKSDNAKEKYLLTSAGQKLYNKHNRYVKIHFKNGAVRTIFVSGINIKPESQLLKLKAKKTASN
jgi:DNA invertase Pin-like site-specific DNA recombinase